MLQWLQGTNLFHFNRPSYIHYHRPKQYNVAGIKKIKKKDYQLEEAVVD